MLAKVAIITLGCDKNTVDSENMLGLLKQHNYQIVNEPSVADVIVINTCGFITAAKEESIDVILEAIQLKEINPRVKIIVAGCMVQKYIKELAEELPEVDGFLGSNNVPGLIKLMDQVLAGERVTTITKASVNPDLYIPRVTSTPFYYSYLKIAEGCNNKCSYCAIPLMRGPYSSRSIPSLVQEAKALADNGVKELSLVAQDITLYGIDLYGRKSLVELLKKLVLIPELEWLRLMYCYPSHVTDELIDFIAENIKICKYIDLPLQHAHGEILRKMGRKQKVEDVIKLIIKLRNRIPHLALRTTFIVGFPGETEEHFNSLLNFMEEIQFDWVGIFTYSPEEGTPAADLPLQVPEKVKQERYHRAMLLQKEITHQRNKRWLGTVQNVLVEGLVKKEKGQVWQGRIQQQAPEVDGVVYFQGDNLVPGTFVPISITGVEGYDLLGEIKIESC